MAKYTGPDCRLCRREGVKLNLKGEKCMTDKCPFAKRPVAPGQHGSGKKKLSEYAVQLREKQKLKRIYGMLEDQFRIFYERAAKSKESTGLKLLQLLECRLDNVVYRMGIGKSRTHARQIVNHGHITVNGRKVNIPSFIVKVGDVIAVKENKTSNGIFTDVKGSKVVMPKWLEFNSDNLSGKILSLPAREDIDYNIQEHMIVELYSR